MTELALYAAAKAALAEVVRVDEVKDIRDKAVAMQAYARQAKDTELIQQATEIRLRAERRAGELLKAMAETGDRAGRGQPSPEKSRPGTLHLRDIGVSKTQSHRWQKLAGMSDQAFEAQVATASKQAAHSLNAAQTTAEKQERRAEREVELGARVRALPDKRYGVIVADPEWRMSVYSEETGRNRAADNHYPTSDLEAIKARPVNEIAAEDCTLFLWATAPMLDQAIDVMRAWGFAYKSHVIWAKDRVGMGFWFRNKHELLLVGTRGNVPAPAPGTQWESVQEFKVREHSAKPDGFLKMIEAYFPTVPKIELNRRGPAREGWDAWGLEAE